MVAWIVGWAWIALYFYSGKANCNQSAGIISAITNKVCELSNPQDAALIPLAMSVVGIALLFSNLNKKSKNGENT